MNKVVLDPILQSKSNGLNQHLELCDESGRTIGHFLPAQLFTEMLMASAGAQITEEELARRRQEPRGRTLAEIWRTLGRQWATQ